MGYVKWSQTCYSAFCGQIKKSQCFCYCNDLRPDGLDASLWMRYSFGWKNNEDKWSWETRRVDYFFFLFSSFLKEEVMDSCSHYHTPKRFTIVYTCTHFVWKIEMYTKWKMSATETNVDYNTQLQAFLQERWGFLNKKLDLNTMCRYRWYSSSSGSSFLSPVGNDCRKKEFDQLGGYLFGRVFCFLLYRKGKR